MQGSLTVTSTPHIGSTFTILLGLPVVTNPHETTALKSQETKDISMSLLVAEDNLVNQTLIATI